MIRAVLLLALVVLAGCASRAPLPPERPARPAAKAPSQPLPTSRQGGYYGDDGPADNVPVDLAAVPDAVPRAEPPHPRANRPYVVFGREYVPLPRATGWRDRGMASWYGRKFHGQPTSSGEPYDMFGMTAAHPTLPIPSYVRVTHVGNGRSVVVRVNDRGPFLHDRLIDLSYAAAWKLGYVQRGSAEVEIELLAPESDLQRASLDTGRPAAASMTAGQSADASMSGAQSSPNATSAAAQSNAAAVAFVAPASGPRLQLGAFASPANAEAARLRMLSMFDGLGLALQVVERDGMARVMAGPFPSGTAAREAAERIRGLTGDRPLLVPR